MNKYLSAIRKNVCAICVDSNEKGKCTLNDDEICAVELYLPQIVEVVHSVESENIKDYVDALRKDVCLECRAQTAEGQCYLREDVNCSLDRQYALIVETIKEVDARKVN